MFKIQFQIVASPAQKRRSPNVSLLESSEESKYTHTVPHPYVNQTFFNVNLRRGLNISGWPGRTHSPLPVATPLMQIFVLYYYDTNSELILYCSLAELAYQINQNQIQPDLSTLISRIDPNEIYTGWKCGYINKSTVIKPESTV